MFNITSNPPSTGLTQSKPGAAQPAAAKDNSGEHFGSVLHKRHKKQLQDMQAALEQMQALKKNSSPKKTAKDRANLLKQRLETLKSVMAKLPPGDYKALAQEIKQIAKELAALGKQLGNSGNNATSLPALPSGFAQVVQHTASAATDIPEAGATLATDMSAILANPVQTAASPDNPQDMHTAANTVTDTSTGPAIAPGTTASAEQAASQTAQNSKTDTKQAFGKPGLNTRQQDQKTEDKELHAALNEARKVLKQVLNLLKAKHQANDKESRKLLDAAQSELDTLEQHLFYSALSFSSPEPASDNAAAPEITSPDIGSFVDTRI